ncbi:NEQ158 [Nanoarchaeum equitans Kin4-M]|uniref:NEQ158 n=1 Tax=Nanoarchaeum equitans (strain Kin4-M) TaxID=228908 RepID=Q74MN0_NANEQ|nr:NEQ158 [Nanoarchaeum equitans Kin4-M]
MKNLEFKGEYKDLIISGKKVATIRIGKLPIKKGQKLYIHSGGYVIGEAIVKDVKIIRLKDIDNDMAKKDGFESKEELIAKLKEHYPFLKKDEPLTYIEFEFKPYENPIPSEDFAWQGFEKNPIEIAKIGIEKKDELLLSNKEVELLKILIEEGSIRKAALRLGNLKKREIFRRILRKIMRRLQSMESTKDLSE